MARTVPEWVGATDDAKVPTRVRMRVFLAHGGVCHLSKRRITVADEWDLDHIKSLKRGGEHRESNLAPAIRDKHHEKTSAENSEDAKTARIAAKHHGQWPKGQRIPSRSFQKRGAM